MKLKLLGGAALAIALAVSSGAWANPKNSFSNNNTITVNSDASADAEAGTTSGKCNNCTVFSTGGAGNGGGSADGNSATSNAISESFNVSIEAVEVSTLSSHVTDTYVEEFDSGNQEIDWRDAIATASGNTLSQASASNGIANSTTQGQSVAAAAIVTLP
jgi:hypothetical protein